MILSHRALTSLNMSSYRATWTRFGPNFIFFEPKISDPGPKILILVPKISDPGPQILILVPKNIRSWSQKYQILVPSQKNHILGPSNCFCWGAAAPQTPCCSWGASSPPCPPAQFLKGSPFQALHFFGWYHDLGTQKKRRAREAEPLSMQGGMGGCKPPMGSGGPTVKTILWIQNHLLTTFRPSAKHRQPLPFLGGRVKPIHPSRTRFSNNLADKRSKDGQKFSGQILKSGSPLLLFF